MKAVILAAGVSSRLGTLTKDRPKCMLPIFNKKTLIKYQIEKLKKMGIKEKNIFIIAGYKINVLKNHLKDTKVHIIFNPKFKEWNNIYTFYLISKITEISNNDKFILLNSDTFFHEDILAKLINASAVNCVVLDIFKKLGWEEMKVLTKNNRVLRFGKDIPIEKATGEYIGLAKFRKGDLMLLFYVIERLIQNGNTDMWYEIAFNYITDKLEIEYIDTNKKPWIEIDTIEDYNKAKNLMIEYQYDL